MKQVIAINDDTDTCSCCGRTNLKRVVWIRDNVESDPTAYGTGCAATAMGFARKAGATMDWKYQVVRTAAAAAEAIKFESYLLTLDPTARDTMRAKRAAQIARIAKFGY